MTIMIDSPRLADVVFCPAAQETLSGCTPEQAAAVLLAYHEPHTRSVVFGSSHYNWHTRGDIALVVDDRDSSVVRVVYREVEANTVSAVPETKPVGRRVKGGRGGHTLPTDSIDFLARCQAAGLCVEETGKGNHWKITSPDPRYPGLVQISSTTNPSEIAESVACVRRRLGVDLRTISKRAAKRRARRSNADWPPKLIIPEGQGPTRAQAAARTWTRPEPSADGDPVTALADTAMPDTQPTPDPTPDAPDMDALLGMAQTAAHADRNMPLAEKNARIFAYVKAARAQGQTDAASAARMGIPPQNLAARISTARRAGDPDAPPAVKIIDQSYRDRRGSTSLARPGPKKTTGRTGPTNRTTTAKPASTRRVATQPDTAAAVDEWLAEHAEDVPVTQAAADVEAWVAEHVETDADATPEPEPEDRSAHLFGIVDLSAGPDSEPEPNVVADAAPDTEPEPVIEDDEPRPETDQADGDADADIDDGSSYGSLRSLGMRALADTVTPDASSEAERGYPIESLRPTPAYEGLVSPEVVPFEAQSVPTPDRGTLGEILAELREFRAERRLVDPIEPAAPGDVLLSALIAADVSITPRQLSAARAVLADAGWALRIEGRF